jgi:sulfonate transport system permease protein
LRAALPSYLTGLRSGLGLGWMFVVAAELMGASKGLGYLMVDGQTTSRPELIMGSILLFAALGKLSDYGLERLGERLQHWRAP